jgi:hypothetical protein
MSASAFGYRGARATVGKTSGKWYYESKINDTPSNNFSFGIATSSEYLGNYVGATSASRGWRSNQRLNPGSVYYGPAPSVDDVIMVAADLDNGELYFGSNGTWFEGSDPATNTEPALSVPADTWYPMCSQNGNGTAKSQTANFAPAHFAYSVPSGYNPWSA